MKILFDTNVILDVLLNRHPFSNVAINLFSTVEMRDLDGYLCATTLTTVDYLVAKAISKRVAKESIRKLLRLFNVAEVNKSVLALAIDSGFADFEDAVLYMAGTAVHVDGFVTRNVKDFKKASLPIYTPDELWSILVLPS